MLRRAIIRSSAKVMLLSAGVGAVLGLVLWLAWSAALLLVVGPREINIDDVPRPGEGRWFGTRVLLDGGSYWNGAQPVSNANNWAYRIYETRRGDLVLLESARTEPPTVLVGRIAELAPALRARIEADLPPQARGRLSPMMVVDESTRLMAWSFAVLWGVPACLVSWFFVRAFRRLLAWRSHPVWHSLVRYGEPEVIADELNTLEGGVRFGPVISAGGWWVIESIGRVRAVKLANIAWAYHPRFAGTEVAKRLVLLEWGGHKTQFGAREDVIEQLLAEIRRELPSVPLGHTPELHSLWVSNPAGFFERYGPAGGPSPR